jgi:hypothetical protein
MFAVNSLLSDGPLVSSFSSNSAVPIALLSIIWSVLTRSGSLLARHMAQRAAAMANVAWEAGASAHVLLF